MYFGFWGTQNQHVFNIIPISSLLPDGRPPVDPQLLRGVHADGLLPGLRLPPAGGGAPGGGGGIRTGLQRVLHHQREDLPAHLLLPVHLLLVQEGTPAYPTTNGGMQKWKLSRNMYTLHTRFRTFGIDLHAQSVLIKQNFCIGAQSEVY